MIVDAWLEDTQTLNVRFDHPITVPGGSSTDVGAWIINDTIEGEIVPTELIQTDVDTIWLITATNMTSGSVGYSAANPGGLSTPNGFPATDEEEY